MRKPQQTLADDIQEILSYFRLPLSRRKKIIIIVLAAATVLIGHLLQ